MITELITPELFDRIEALGASTDFAAARLKAAGNDMQLFAILQAECRNKCRSKLAATLSNPRFLFPDRIAAEQATDERIAQFHASLIDDGAADMSLMDATAGLGIDAMAMASRGARVTAFDLRPAAAEALAHNAAVSGLNMEVRCEDSIEFLRSADVQFDVIFIDPARRDSDGRRLFSLADCAPDVVANLQLLMSHTRRLIIKASPMLDVTQTLRDLPGASEIYAVGTVTECKELLIVVDRGEAIPEGVSRAAVTIIPGSEQPEIFRFDCRSLPPAAYASIIEAGMILYEPYPSVMKMDMNNEAADACGAVPIAPNTHLLVSQAPIGDFPGRSYTIEAVLPAGARKASRMLKTLLDPGERLNVTCRNFPMTPGQLVATLGLREGGTRRLFAISDAFGRHHLLLTRDLAVDSGRVGVNPY